MMIDWFSVACHEGWELKGERGTGDSESDTSLLMGPLKIHPHLSYTHLLYQDGISRWI